MKSAFLVRNGDPLRAFEVRESDKAVPGVGQVGITVECFGLNYADVQARNGLYKAAPPIPSVLGYEVVGTITETGEGVDPVWLGKRVVAFTRFGGYSEYAVTPVEAVAEIGDLDAGEATCIATQFVTAWYMTHEAIRLNEGDYVLVHAGAGGVGTALIQMCKDNGCYVIATAGSADKLKFMQEQGADLTINYRAEDYEKVIREKLKGRKLDATFNAIAGSTFKKDFSLVGTGGKVLLFGAAELSGTKWGIFSKLNFVRKMGLMLPIVLLAQSKSLIGVNMLNIGDDRPEILRRCLLAATSKVRSGQYKPVVGKSFHISELGEAHAYLESRKSIGKVVVYWGKR